MADMVVYLPSHTDFAVADDPNAWISVAETLFASATVLWEREIEPAYREIREQGRGPFDHARHAPVAKRLLHRRAFALLCGYAIENLLKACTVARLRKSGKSVIKNAALKGLAKHHRLLTMCRDEGLTLSKREEILLEQLETAVSWMARYPVSLTAKTTVQRGAQSTDWDTASRLVKRLVAHCSSLGA